MDTSAELLSFILLGALLLLVIICLCLTLRKHKKILVALISLILIGYFLYFTFYSTIEKQVHERAYNALLVYLEQKHPNIEFIIESKLLEPGVDAGSFFVYPNHFPEIGVQLKRQRDGSFKQVASTSRIETSHQEDIWKTLYFSLDDGNLIDENIPVITKLDSWIKDDLTVFALLVNDKPTIATFTYKVSGYGLYDVKYGNIGEYVMTTHDNLTFLLIDERYEGDSFKIVDDDKSYIYHSAEDKGKLIVLE